MGGGDLLHHLRVFVEDAGEVHHLTQVFDRGVFQQPGNSRGIEGGASGLEAGGGDAAGSAEIKVERNGASIVEHVFDAGQAADVGYFVRIADGGDGAMDGGETRKFR